MSLSKNEIEQIQTAILLMHTVYINDLPYISRPGIVLLLDKYREKTEE